MTADLTTGLAGAAWPRARAAAHHAAGERPAQSVPLEFACGRVLAADLTAHTALPAFTASAMDGWAVAGPGPWRLVGEAAAGRPHPTELIPGTGVWISTGAQLPPGADRVIRRERGVRHGRRLTATTDVGPGADIRPAGEERRAGEILATAGRVVTPPLVGLAAATGHDTLKVRARPAVAVLTLGDELLRHGRARPGRPREAIGVQLPGWIAALGGKVTTVEHRADRLDAVVAAIDSAAADVVVTTGGSSAGRHDHVRAALGALGATLVIDSVAVRPGHPMLLAGLPDGRQLVGLPGNPGAAVAGVLTLLAPLVDGLLGRPLGALSLAWSGVDVGGRPRHRLLPAVNVGGQVWRTDHTGPAMLSGWAAASCALVVPPGGVCAGAAVEVLALPYAADPTPWSPLVDVA